MSIADAYRIATFVCEMHAKEIASLRRRRTGKTSWDSEYDPHAAHELAMLIFESAHPRAALGASHE